jgi:hypothetical protein
MLIALLSTISALVSYDACGTLGFDNLSLFAYNFPISRKYETTAEKLFLPIYSSSSPFITNQSITKLIIAIHGLSGDGYNVFCSSLHSAQGSNNREKIMVIAPMFSTYPVLGNNFSPNGLLETMNSTSSFWTDNWMSGGNDVRFLYQTIY